MRVGDTVAAIGDGRLYVGRITGDAVQASSPGGLSNLRRTVTWSPRNHAYEDLPEEVQQKLSVQHDVVDLTGVLEALDELTGQPERTAPTAAGEKPTAERPATRELSLPDISEALAEDLLVHDRGWLDEMRELLVDERQLVFYGPPGTGKTFLAMKLAEYLGGGPEQVKIVQFHPSYAYEDFFEGFRPVEDPETREVAFRLTAGPLRELADLASREGNRHLPHFLIIDEINRANLARVFGELYFLLEYRDRSVRLTYSGDDFPLPPNLFVIGTMNTADRSIALVDAAMRRRFAFVELSPRTEPTAGLLARWLEREGRDPEPARLLDALNARIDDADFAIGPSYLMKPGVYRDGGLERTWRTKILPLLEEYHYGEGLDVAATASTRCASSSRDGARVRGVPARVRAGRLRAAERRGRTRAGRLRHPAERDPRPWPDRALAAQGGQPGRGRAHTRRSGRADHAQDSGEPAVLSSRLQPRPGPRLARQQGGHRRYRRIRRRRPGARARRGAAD
jgi:5-methylcytosine-specific restriction protein B